MFKTLFLRFMLTFPGGAQGEDAGRRTGAFGAGLASLQEADWNSGDAETVCLDIWH